MGVGYLKKRGVKNNVCERRKILKIRQEDLAKDVGVARQTIIAIEKGRYEPTIGVALLIARSLNSTVENLFYFDID
jgi:putative transcriptional regulator